MPLKILTLGDIVGDPGVKLLTEELPAFLSRHAIDFTVANAENSASGSGITPAIARDLYRAGVDVLTTGDHVWKRKAIHGHIGGDERLLRAANYNRAAPGRGFTVVRSRGGDEIGVLHVIGRLFMRPIDCPFAAADQALEQLSARTKVIVVDVHAEATSEKFAVGHYLDGRVSAVFGTHTHVPTADAQVLPRGTGYITDVGMTGPYASILGRQVTPVVRHFVTGLPFPFDVATEDVRAGAAVFTIDSASGRCLGVERVELRKTKAADRP
jgi:metallophosphoesterase (TIGR00282 family)